jgi:hypothetical protein
LQNPLHDVLKQVHWLVPDIYRGFLDHVEGCVRLLECKGSVGGYITVPRLSAESSVASIFVQGTRTIGASRLRRRALSMESPRRGVR